MSVLESEVGQAHATGTVPVTVIEPSRGWLALDLKELWDYRELLYFLIWRDVKVKYKQTIIGAGWAILQPFMTMIVFTLVFNEDRRHFVRGYPIPYFRLHGSPALEPIRRSA